eukprot:995117-Alexandrium_andersonii.AAC.1
MFDCARPARADPSTRGPPSAEAPSTVGVHKVAESDPLILPGEVVDRTGPQHQVPGQPQESRPVRSGGR